MKKLVFVLAVTLSACGEASTEVVSTDSTKVSDTTIVDTLKKK